MWAKFGQMAGKAISKIKKPKGFKAKAMGMVQSAKSKVKGYKDKAVASYKKAYKKNPTAVPLATAAGIGLATYPLMKDTEIVQSRVRMRKEAEKVRKEIKAGKKISFKERYKRLSEAGKMRSFP